MTATRLPAGAPARTYGTLRLAGDEWHVTAEPHILLRIKRVFERVDKGQHGTVTLAATPENARDLEWFVGRYPLAVEHPAELAAAADAHRDHVLTMDRLIDPDYRPQAFPLALPPRDYQARMGEVVLAQGFVLNGDDLGLGKTVEGILPMTDPRALPAVVVCHPHLQRQWADELAKFMPSLSVHTVRKGTPYELPRPACPACRTAGRRRKCADPACRRGPDVLIITYHKLSGWAEVLAAYCRYAAFDEVQELRHTTSEKYAAALHIARAAAFRQGMSATPIFNYGGEIYNVLDVLKPGCLGTRVEFHREWCTSAGNGKQRIADAQAFGSFLRENALMLRRTREEVGRQLPPLTRVPHRIGSDAKAFDAAAGGSAEELAKFLLSGSAEAFRGEHMQKAGEFDAMMRQATGLAKAPFVAEFVNLLLESGERVVLAGWHRAVYAIWEERLVKAGRRVVWYTGSESPAAKAETKRAFVAGEADVMLLSLRSGAGLDGLQTACRTIVFGELDWSPGVMEQCAGRLHRDGQADNVVAYFLVSDEGADPIMSEVLGLKRQQLEGIRDPTGDLIERLQAPEDGIRRLAERYLATRNPF